MAKALSEGEGSRSSAKAGMYLDNRCFAYKAVKVGRERLEPLRTDGIG